MQPIHLLLVSGSLQRVSTNRALLDVATQCARGVAHVSQSEHIGTLPHFNPDIADDDQPALTEWRNALATADGVIIASPEYAHSLPGSLKNALDWIVGSGELYDKPVALMSAGTSGGERALDALAQTLRAQGANVVGRVSVAGVRPKLDEHGNIADPDTITEICGLVADLVAAANTARSGPTTERSHKR